MNPMIPAEPSFKTTHFSPLSRGLACSLVFAGALSARAAFEFPPEYEWDIELLSMDLNAQSVLLPLGPDWGDILTDIHIGESVNLASKGKAGASRGINETLPTAPAGPPAPGDSFFVQSFFDVFFDITVTDVDPAVNFGGGPIDGLSLPFLDNGPARMENFYKALFDPNAPNFGLIPPPESSPYIGHFNIEIPLGADLNGNGENDKIKFTLVTHAAGDANRTFITLPNGTVIDTFDSVLNLSGAVVDESDDPLWGPIELTGPTVASSKLLGLPDGGSTGMCLALGLAGLFWGRRQVRRSASA